MVGNGIRNVEHFQCVEPYPAKTVTTLTECLLCEPKIECF